MPAPPEMTPTEFRQRWPEGGDDTVLLLDVREHHELELASVGGAVHIPMGQVPARVGELDKELAIVVMCHGGGRSRRVAEFLLGSGFTRVFNLAGGIDAWSREIDSKIPRY